MVGYLADLGVTHAYSSPLLRSAEGSTHGYDTVDHAHIDEARGGRAGFDRFVAALHEHGLGLVLDLVPNHMGVADAAATPWWWDVLQHGRKSRHAAAFDIDWEFGGGKVRIPVLGAADDVAALKVVDGELHYYDNRFPIAPGTERRHAAGGARPAALRAGRLAPRGLRPQLPPVLRDQHPRRAAGRGPGDLRRHPRARAPARAGRRRRRAADRPPRRAGRPEGLPGPARRGVGEPVDGRREDPRARRGPAGVLADRRDDGLRRPGRGRRGADRPGRRGGADRAGHRARRPADRLRRAGARRASARSPTACSARRSPGWSG